MADGMREHVSALVIPAVTVGALAVADGGFFPRDWRWAGVGLAALGLGALLAPRTVALGRSECVLLVTVAALAGWVALSAAWSADASRSLLEAERALVLLLGLVAFLLWVGRAALGHAVAGLLAGITAAEGYGLGRYLLGERVLERVEQGLLFQPIGYSNAVAILSALGALLAAGVMAKGPRVHAALAGGALVVLLTAMTLSGSRAAWLALVCGGAALVLLDPERWKSATRLVVLAIPGLVAVGVAARADLASVSLSPADFESDALRVGLVVLVLVGVAVLLGLLLPSFHPRLRLLQWAAGLLAAAVGATVLAFALAERSESLDLGIRSHYWRVAWDAYADEPWLGTGAGTYELSWAARRPVPDQARDAHSLYLETLSELGPVGVGLLLIALAVPLVVAISVRESAFVPSAGAAYVAYLVHAAFDWDWEVPAVTLAALFSGAAVLVAARSDAQKLSLSRPSIVTAAALELAACALLLERLASGA